jgi:creatinine amidohydrolase
LIKVRMGEITASEMREILLARPVVLLPLGSFEDQGPHAPMGDYLSAERMAELIAERATMRGTRTLVAPVLAYGGADYFGTAPGGIALGQETFRSVLRDMFGCLLRHDVSRLVVVNGHAGNTQAVLDTAREIWRARRILIPSFYLWKIARGLMPGIVGAEKTKQTSGHGGDPLTSIATHLFPQWMRPDLTPPPHDAPEIIGMPVTGFGTASFEGAEIDVPIELSEITPDAVFGADRDAPMTKPEEGRQWVREMKAKGILGMKCFGYRPDVLEAANAAIRSGETRSVEYETSTQVERHTRCYVAPMTWGHERAAMLVFHDQKLTDDVKAVSDARKALQNGEGQR